MTIPDRTDAPLESPVGAPEAVLSRPGPAAWRRWSVLVLVGVVSMLVGAGAAAGALLVTGLSGQPVHRYTVNVYLDSGATADQKAAVEAALPAFKPDGEVKFTNREEAWRRFQEVAKERPDVLREAKKDYMPESFGLATKGRLFDCTGYAKVRHMPGVDQVQVLQGRVNGYVAVITCDAEYANP